jgi:ubiquinone/menaquinone biosynthesis C-methylase UbiE
MSRRWGRLRKMKRERGYLDTIRFLGSKVVYFVKAGTVQPPTTIEANLDLWSRYDWSLQGEEWTLSSEWKQSLVRHVLEPNIPMGSRVLEIGPGAGRWTEHLLQRAKHVSVVDLTPECIRMCKEKFKGVQNISYFVNDGQDLSFIRATSIDRIWSFGVFVHMQSTDAEKYIAQFSSILVPGGRGVINHGAEGAKKRGWRSDITTQMMVEMCNRHGLSVLQQFDSWDNCRCRLSEPDTDIVTIFEKRV